LHLQPRTLPFTALLSPFIPAQLAGLEIDPAVTMAAGRLQFLGPAGRTSPSSGGEMYRAYCAACHGLGGKGDGPASSALKPAPTDLTQLAKRNSGKFPELQVFGAINGDVQVPAHGSKDMPVWGVVFRRMGDNSVSGATLRMRNLTRYIESLQQ
jgi:mono/diheme cytochrome c family protein